MLRRTHVQPFLTERDRRLEVRFLERDDRVVGFLDRLCRLARRLEGRPVSAVREALRRQERRVRDSRRLAGVSKALLDRCELRAPPGAGRAPAVREALFRARGGRWPPVPGDREEPYEAAARALSLPPPEVHRLLYADRPEARLLVRAPDLDGAGLLDAYNFELARAVLLDAARVTIAAAGGWGAIFRAVKLARLMYRLEPAADGHAAPSGPTGEDGPAERYRVELTGPAADFVTRPERYGVRFARVIPALARAPDWALDAEIEREGRALRYRLDPSALPLSPAAEPADGYDSSWERGLAEEFAEKLGPERDGWTLRRERTPVAIGDELLLPDFTLRHADGRRALVEIVGFWTPEYLERKLGKVRAAGRADLVLVVYRGLAAGEEGDDVAARIEAAAAGPVVWFARRPRIGPVMEAVERAARAPEA